MSHNKYFTASPREGRRLRRVGGPMTGVESPRENVRIREVAFKFKLSCRSKD